MCAQVLKELLDVGAPVDLTCEAGWTPLHRACFSGHAAVAQELVVARKANMLAATKDGRTPILLAAQGGAKLWSRAVHVWQLLVVVSRGHQLTACGASGRGVQETLAAEALPGCVYRMCGIHHCCHSCFLYCRCCC